MDDLLCDELLEQVFHRLPPSSNPTTTTTTLSLVSKRWLRVSRSSTTTLSLRLSNPFTASSLLSFLSTYPYLSSLSVLSPPDSFFHHLFVAAISSLTDFSSLTQLRLFTPPISSASVALLSTACAASLVSLCITVSANFDFTCLTAFHCLKDLSVLFSEESEPVQVKLGLIPAEYKYDGVGLPLESLSVSGVLFYNRNMDWLWRSCKRLRILKLKCCQGLGAPFFRLDGCFAGLEQIELRTCRTIVDKVLAKLSQVSRNIESLLVYDGGSRDGLINFINNCKSDLRRLDFRLPLDFDDDHLYAIGRSFSGLTILRLQSCCLVTAQGLKSFAESCNGLRELSLVSCDVVEREPGLLAALGQNLKMLRTLDLSYNETLQDKELISMLSSCGYLNELILRGCQRLTNASLLSISRSCKQLRVVDIGHCWKLEAEFVEMFVLSSPLLRKFVVEEGKVTEVAKSWMWRKSIDCVFA